MARSRADKVLLRVSGSAEPPYLQAPAFATPTAADLETHAQAAHLAVEAGAWSSACKWDALLGSRQVADHLIQAQTARDALVLG
jgi:hypothetical protein